MLPFLLLSLGRILICILQVPFACCVCTSWILPFPLFLTLSSPLSLVTHSSVCKGCMTAFNSSLCVQTFCFCILFYYPRVCAFASVLRFRTPIVVTSSLLRARDNVRHATSNGVHYSRFLCCPPNFLKPRLPHLTSVHLVFSSHLLFLKPHFTYVQIGLHLPLTLCILNLITIQGCVTVTYLLLCDGPRTTPPHAVP